MKGFSKNSGFHGFPSLGFQSRGKSMIPLYGKDAAIFWVDAGQGIPSGISSGSLISHWSDMIFGSYFQNTVAASQPRWIESDATFNGLPVVEAHTIGRGLIESTRKGPVFGPGQTLALVYQYITAGGNNPYPHSLVLGHFESFPDGRYLTYGYNWRCANAPTTTGICRGTQGSPNQKSAEGLSDTSVRIVVISKSAFINNGASITPFIDSWNQGGLLNAIGGAGNTNVSGTFKLAEAALWDRDYNDSACIDICNELNAKYSIY